MKHDKRSNGLANIMVRTVRDHGVKLFYSAFQTEVVTPARELPLQIKDSVIEVISWGIKIHLTIKESRGKVESETYSWDEFVGQPQSWFDQVFQDYLNL